ncbi:Ubiquitin thioesterase trabid [Frankliniella fusca]|uniref:ubiquitinyl hydrolase 1 n=1 Tax=Frankliniella fusca TaxID=407009 RepID=A0AAE1LU75_9NEOP|nr:Ubiquitin thioesterase trabid [Frankliniella fusca]
MSSTCKWTCEYCTYENWPSTLKCTMCRGAKPLLGEDIYRLQDEEDSLSNTGGVSLASGPLRETSCPTNGKWSCEACTYLNWERAGRCVQCYTPKSSKAPAEVPVAGRAESPSREQCEAASVRICSSSPTPSERDASLLHGYKWPCSICTYENWPKAQRCVMCNNPAPNNAANPCRTSPRLSPRNSPRASPSVNDNGRSSPQDDLANALRSLSVSRRVEGSNESVIQAQLNNCEYERRLRQLRRQASWGWLAACMGVVDGDPNPVEAYLAAGGDPARQLTASEVSLLNRPSAFDVGYTLVHLAIRFHRDDLLAQLLSQIEGGGSGMKRVPSYVAPDLAADIRRHVATTLRQRKGSFPCYYVTEITTFTLPDTDELPTPVQDQLLQELLDNEAQATLEAEPGVINWSLELTVHLGSRLYALWNRSAGDCLLDSLMQATWGVFDRDNLLRRALADSLHQCGHVFYPRWKDYETAQARLLHFSLEEAQWQDDWASLLSLASQPGSSLEQLHIFALAHILRRPIIVYGVKYVKSFRGEDIGYARFEGVYLPLLWEPSFCTRSPLALGYTRGHFCALVSMEPDTGSVGQAIASDCGDISFLPLMDRERKLLPVHFLTQNEMGDEEALMRQWLDVSCTESGLLVAHQTLRKRPLLVGQMVEEWLNHYRRLAQMTSAPFARPVPVQDYSSEGDSDEE